MNAQIAYQNQKLQTLRDNLQTLAAPHLKGLLPTPLRGNPAKPGVGSRPFRCGSRMVTNYEQALGSLADEMSDTEPIAITPAAPDIEPEEFETTYHWFYS